MQRPALATLACINPDCHHGGRPGQGHLAIRKVYGKDHIRLLRCSCCHEEFSERRNTALFNTKVREAKAEALLTISMKGAVSVPRLDSPKWPRSLSPACSKPAVAMRSASTIKRFMT